MEFTEPRPIYMQIADMIAENILSRLWIEDERIPSVRELAMEIEVNPNTVMRSYTYLQDQGVLYNKRGIGFFVHRQACETLKRFKRKDFVGNELPRLFGIMDLLNIGMPELIRLNGQYRKNQKGRQHEDGQ